jgi:hypothetical protein
MGFQNIVIICLNMVEQREYTFSLWEFYFENGNIFLEVIKLTLISKNTKDLKGASYTLGTIRGVEMIKSWLN